MKIKDIVFGETNKMATKTKRFKHFIFNILFNYRHFISRLPDYRFAVTDIFVVLHTSVLNGAERYGPCKPVTGSRTYTFI